MTSVLIAVSREDTLATRLNAFFTGLDLKDFLKRVSTQIEIESQATILQIRTDIGHDDSEALRNFAIRRALFCNRVTNVCRSLPDITDSVAGLDSKVAVVQPVQTDDAVSSKALEDGTRLIVVRTSNEVFLEFEFVVLLN